MERRKEMLRFDGRIGRKSGPGKFMCPAACFLILVLIWGHGYPAYWVLLLPLLFLQWGIAQGVSWLVAAVTVYLRDVAQLVSLGLTVWMFLSPILYPLDMVPDEWRSVIWLNPVTWLVDGYRAVILEGRCPSWTSWLLLASVALGASGGGYRVFQKLKAGFSDVL